MDAAEVISLGPVLILPSLELFMIWFGSPGRKSGLRSFSMLRPFITVATSLALVMPLSSPASTQVLKPLVLQLDWKPTAQFAGMLMASRLGFYKQEGLDVSILPADATMATVSLVAHQANAIGVAEADVVLVDRAKGYRIKAFGAILQTTPFSLFTLKASGLTSFGSLRGKRIGLYGDGEKAIDVLLKFNGMSRKDVTLVNIPLSLQPLISGQVDAMQGYVVDEAVRLKMEGHPVNIIRMADNGYVSYAEVLFASTALVDKHPDELAGFLRASRRGWEYAIDHPDETARTIVSDFLPDGSVEEQRESLRQVIPLLGDPKIVGGMQPDTWDKAVQMFNQYQFADRTVSASDLVDYSILDRLDRQTPPEGTRPNKERMDANRVVE